VQIGPATNVTLVGSQGLTFDFAYNASSNSGTNTGTNCPTTGGGFTYDRFDMDTSPPFSLGSTADNWTNQGGIEFCSGVLSGQTVSLDGTATVYARNTGNGNCLITGVYGVNGTSNTATTTATIQNDGVVHPLTFNFGSGAQVTMATGARIDLLFKWATSFCQANGSKVSLFWGSTTYPSSFLAGQPITPPNPATNLTVTRSNGSATLTWTPSSAGTTVDRYYIYRDGQGPNNRLPDSSDPQAQPVDPNFAPNPPTDPNGCTATQCTWVDPVNDTNTHTYYVTAVGSNTSGFNMAESTMTPGATG
jgi:hypothetical protein